MTDAESQFLLVQVTLHDCALRALIATHPSPEALRSEFDALLGQMQAQWVASGAADPAAMALVRQTAARLFDETSSKPQST